MYKQQLLSILNLFLEESVIKVQNLQAWYTAKRSGIIFLINSFTAYHPLTLIKNYHIVQLIFSIHIYIKYFQNKLYSNFFWFVFTERYLILLKITEHHHLQSSDTFWMLPWKYSSRIQVSLWNTFKCIMWNVILSNRKYFQSQVFHKILNEQKYIFRYRKRNSESFLFIWLRTYFPHGRSYQLNDGLCCLHF